MFNILHKVFARQPKPIRVACTKCGYNTRMIEDAVCVQCREQQATRQAAAAEKMADQFADARALFQCLEVGLEGCPHFEDLPDTEGMLSKQEWVDSFIYPFAITRSVTIRGTSYEVRITPKG